MNVNRTHSQKETKYPRQDVTGVEPSRKLSGSRQTRGYPKKIDPSRASLNEHDLVHIPTDSTKQDSMEVASRRPKFPSEIKQRKNKN